MHFVVVFDKDILSACERVLGREVQQHELSHSRTGNMFLRGWVNTHFTIFEGEAPISSSIRFEPANLYVKKDSKVEKILAGLVEKCQTSSQTS